MRNESNANVPWEAVSTMIFLQPPTYAADLGHRMGRASVKKLFSILRCRIGWMNAMWHFRSVTSNECSAVVLPVASGVDVALLERLVLAFVAIGTLLLKPWWTTSSSLIHHSARYFCSIAVNNMTIFQLSEKREVVACCICCYWHCDLLLCKQQRTDDIEPPQSLFRTSIELKVCGNKPQLKAIENVWHLPGRRLQGTSSRCRKPEFLQVEQGHLQQLGVVCVLCMAVLVGNMSLLILETSR